MTEQFLYWFWMTVWVLGIGVAWSFVTLVGLAIAGFVMDMRQRPR